MSYKPLHPVSTAPPFAECRSAMPRDCRKTAKELRPEKTIEKATRRLSRPTWDTSEDARARHALVVILAIVEIVILVTVVIGILNKLIVIIRSERDKQGQH